MLVVDQKSEGLETVHIVGEVNPRKQGSQKQIKAGKTFKLASGGFTAHEGQQFTDASGRPMVNRNGNRIMVHTVTRHVTIPAADVAERVTGGNLEVATGFISAAHMERAVKECLADRATEINERLNAGGSPAPNGTSVKVTYRTSGKVGYGYSLVVRPSQANKERRIQQRDAVEVEQSDLASVTVIIRVSNSEQGEFMVETAFPTPRG
jgi:hypothetical protein